LESKVEIGGTFAAYYKGDLVVNLWGGYADQKAHRMWKKDTLPCVYSTTKSASLCHIFVSVPSQDLDFKHHMSWYFIVFNELRLEVVVRFKL
jgi:hypothetical protein